MKVVKPLKDKELCERLRSGDESAFTEIYRTHLSIVYQTAFNRLRDKEQCQDIVQNIFASLWDRRESLYIEDFKAYLRMAARQSVYKAFDRNPRKTTDYLDLFEHLITSPEKTDDILLEKEVQILLQHFIDALPRKRREIFIKHYSEYYNTAEIAEQMSISRKTVQNQLNNAEIAFKARLADTMTIMIAAAWLLKK